MTCESGLYGRSLIALLILFVLAHAGLLVHDIVQPDTFTRGDRSFDRLGKTAYVYDGVVQDSWFDKPAELLSPTPGWPGRMVEVGSPGDYLLAGTLLRYLGHLPTVLIQLAVMFAGVLLVFAIGREMGLGPPLSAAGAGIFMLLPGTLVAPHMFVSEAWFLPTLALASWAMLRLYRRGFSPGLLALAIAAWTLTIIFRQQFLLLPLALAALTAWRFRHHRQWRYAPALLLAMVPSLAWSAWSAQVEADWPQRPASFTDVGFQLHNRMLRMNAVTDMNLPADFGDHSSVSPVTFLSYVAHYPWAYARTALSDNADFALNPGTAYLSRYLGVLPQAHMHRGWGAIRDERGVAGMVWFLMTSTPFFAAFMISHAGLHALLVALGLLGLFCWLRHPPPGVDWPGRLFVLGSIAYTLLIIQLSYQSRWSLRQPVEVLFSPLVVFGGLQCRAWWRRWRGRRNNAAATAS